jgi:hypothetical protein
MRNRPSWFVAILLATVVVLGVMPVIKAQPPAPAIWIEPATLNFDTTHTHVGDNFNVTVWASAASDIFTYQVGVTYDPTMLNVTSVKYTGTSGSAWWTGHTTVPASPNIDYVVGSVVVGETLLGSDVVHASNGSICNITFQIIATPTQGNTFTSLIDTNHPDSSYLLDTNLDTIPNVTFGHATYTFSGGGAPPPTRHDVVVSSVTASSQVNQGDLLSIGVVALNNGTVTETFDVNATYDGTLIGKQSVTSLAAGSTQTLTFSWNTTGVAAGNYTITATATPVAGQTDLSNISKTAKVQVLVPTHKPNPYDLNDDGKVDMKDIGIAAKAFGAVPGDPRWNPAADVGGFGVVTVRDVALIAQHFLA